MSILVTGSLALDHVMVFPDRFKNHILPDKIHQINVSFNVPTLDVHFGGTAGNIAYHLRLLGEDPLLLATVGEDFGPYAEWLDKHGIRRDGIKVLKDTKTAQAFVTTDLDDNQIWAFHEGALGRAHEARLADVTAPYSMAIISSTTRQAMLEYGRELKERGIPTAVDPSHALPILDGPDLIELITGSAIYIVNDYEWAMTLEKTGMREDEIAKITDAIVITLGAEGSKIRQGDDTIEIPPASADKIVDPTACGDAYRAGLLCGRSRGLPFEVAGRMGSMMGALVVGSHGTQSLELDVETFRERLKREFDVTY